MKLCFNYKKINQSAYEKFIAKRNKAMIDKFKTVPFSERVVFLPHCMRNSKVCKAADDGTYYTCVQCGACKIAAISSLAKELGYRNVYIMKGGKAILNILRETKPGAVVAVACHFEGDQGIKMTDKEKITTQFVSLLKDGCCDTDVDLEKVKEIMNLK